MATEAQVPASPTPDITRAAPAPWDAPVTVMGYEFPSMEPTRLLKFKQKHLQMPIRKDILHRAIVYEGDMTRQGTASTKWRDEVHGSHRKLIQQKGSGRARVGDRQSPIRKGGGVAHGPHPRDFSTGLPGKIYDQAFRIAFSYRFQRGELIVIDGEIALRDLSTPFLLGKILMQNDWAPKKGRSTFITTEENPALVDMVKELHKYAVVKDRYDVDVKNLLETERLIIEKEALRRMLRGHSRDLRNRPAKAIY